MVKAQVYMDHVMMCGKDPTMGWSKSETVLTKIKTGIMGRKLLLGAELACGN
jgi:hypothetical protein